MAIHTVLMGIYQNKTVANLRLGDVDGSKTFGEFFQTWQSHTQDSSYGSSRQIMTSARDQKQCSATKKVSFLIIFSIKFKPRERVLILMKPTTNSDDGSKKLNIVEIHLEGNYPKTPTSPDPSMLY
jgi:hypothetical protein